MQGRGLEVENRKAEEEDGKEREAEAHRNPGSGLHPCESPGIGTHSCLPDSLLWDCI